MKSHPHSRPAFSLIEVVIALGIASFCLITVFALLPMGINTNQNAFEQTAAAGIATAIAADLHGTPVVSSTTSRFQIIIPQAGKSTLPDGSSYQTLYFSQDGSPAVDNPSESPVGQKPSTSSPTARYRATITFQPADPTSSPITPRNKLFNIWILVTWPALSDPNPAALPANFAGSYETETALNCN